MNEAYAFKLIFFYCPLDALRYFMDELAKCAGERGIDYLIADVSDPDSYKISKLDGFLSDKVPTFMFTMNQAGIMLFDKDGNYWKKRGIPVFDFIQDHPRNYEDVLFNPPCDIKAICLDQNNIKFIKRFYPGIKDIFFMPNGGTEVRGFIPFKDRSIDVLYMGGCQQPVEGFPKINGLPDDGIPFFMEVLEKLKTNSHLTTEEAIEEWFSERNIPVSEDVLLTLNLSAAPYIENAIRRYFKLLGMHALDKAGIHVEIYGGDSWVDSKNPFSDNIHINPRISSSELNSIISDAKISLCYIPWYKKGCSEKNFDSMLNGALCVSDKNMYLSEHYNDRENIVFFDMNAPDKMVADVKWLLEHDEEAERIAHNGYLTAGKYDTWKVRFDYFVDEIIPQYLDADQSGNAKVSNMAEKRLKSYIISCQVDKPLTQEAPESIYGVPIQAGAALTDVRTCALNDLDDCPNSISDRNRRYSEATAMYWIGTHPDSKYVGISHYRRRLNLSDEQLDKMMDDDVDIITTVPVDLGVSIEADYRKVLYSKDWDLFMDILKRRDPEDYEFALECFGSNMLHVGNINIFKSELYTEFWKWTFPILDEFWRTSPEKTDVYQHRDVGFIAERLSHLFVMKMIRDGKKVIEAPLINLSSGEWDCKGECDYNDFDDVYEACERLYKAGQITKCCNVIGESVRQNGKSDDRIKALSEIMVTGILERGNEVLSMHEYLPQNFRTDLNTLIYIWNALKKSLKTFMDLGNDESASLLDGVLKLTHFSKTAQKEAIKYIREENEK